MSKSIFTSDYALFRRLLRDLRAKRGLTQAQLSESLAMPQSFVSKYETGERRLDFVEVRAVCLTLGTSLSAFAKKFETELLKDSNGEVPNE